MDATERRRARIVELVRTHDFVRVADLGEMFGVSTVAVRGDLDVLAARGDIRRIRGGAINHDAPAPDGDPDDVLGRAAAALLPDGECAFVSASAVSVGSALAARDAVIVTNGLEVARALEGGRPTVVVTGGTLGRAGALVDPLGELVVGRMNADMAFVACEAIEAEAGATDRRLAEVAVKRRMLEGAARRVVIVPGNGVGAVRMGAVCPIDDVDVLVTGAGAAVAALEAVRERGVEVVVA
jgi:DeoR family transcriptional regulator, aga operon transcriptional repressor